METKPSANQLHKEYLSTGGTLDFKEWLEREQKKGKIQTAIDLDKEANKIFAAIGPTEKLNRMKQEQKTILGLPVYTLYIAGILITGGIALSLYLKSRK